MKMKAAANVEAYLRGFPAPVRARLKTLRAAIRKAAPGAEEKISYGMVGYKLFGRPLVYFGGFKDHVGFYAMPVAREKFGKELAKYEGGKGSIRFPHDEPIPAALVARLVKFRALENREKSSKNR
jgi:uncharacterized protein YdhG (YjbR/CyaY superfamily)